jgi:glycosyltransferase involved in cell wall biosynthesis
MEPVPLVHFFSAFQSLGGVQSVLRHQLQEDSSRALESELIVYSEPSQNRFERVHFVGPTALDCLFTARLRVRRIVGRLQPRLAVYHGFWGVPHFSDVDAASHRILVIHGDGPCMKQLPEISKWLDGILCVSRPLEAHVRHALPQWNPRRIGLIPYPVHPPIDTSVPQAPLNERPLVFGYAGRLARRQKRVELLPELIRRIDKLGLTFRFELLGDGEERSWLEEQLGSDPRIRFHGMLKGEEYWRVMLGWDAIAYVSDYEGLPISMLEALSMGVIPVFPMIGCGGDEYTARVDQRLLFQRGDVQGAASCLAWLGACPHSVIAALREQCRSVVKEHLGSGYIDTFNAFARGILALPQIASKVHPRRNLVRDLCPEILHERFISISNRLSRTFRPPRLR